MIVNIKKITSAVQKIVDLTNGDNNVPGVMFRLSKLDEATLESNGTLAVCYSDGHKSLVEYISVMVDDNDHIGDIVVDFKPLADAISKCQPTGSIKSKDVVFKYLSENRLQISVTQNYEICDEDGNVVSNKTLSNKEFTLKWKESNADMKAAVLSRMKYDTIFESVAMPDTFDKSELMDVLNRTATEKGKNIYFSSKTQSAFVVNQAHLTIIPISGYEMPDEAEIQEIRDSLTATGTYSEDTLKAEIKKHMNRVNHSTIVRQEVAKALVSILGKCSGNTVQVSRSDTKFCNIVVEDEDEKVGIWFEMTGANKVHTSAVEQYESRAFSTYQMTFLRDFIMDGINSAIDSNKGDKTKIKFTATKLDNPATDTDLTIVTNTNEFNVNLESLTDTLGNIKEQEFVVNLKLLKDIITQLKTDRIAFDFDVAPDGAKSLRVSEIDFNEMMESYKKNREKTKELCDQQGIAFDPSSTPTPVELKTASRRDYLMARQYTMLAR